MTTVGWIGLGAMGTRMAGRLLQAGHELVVWNRTAARADELVARGAALASTPAEAARRADVVCIMVADPEALREVVEGDDGVAAGVPPGAAVIDLSTVGPDAIARLRDALPETVTLLDAPVLGSLSEAESGTLSLFVGGDTADVQHMTGLLEVLGTPLRVGTLGAGAAAKLVANATLLGTLGVLGESLALADGLGLSRPATWQVLARTPLGAQAERRRPAVESGDYPLRFALALAAKDADLITAAAEHAGIDVRLLSAIERWFADARGAGHGDRDYSAVLDHIAPPEH